MAKTLFELTEDHLETGLRGVPVGYCTTSFADPQKGLHYVGKPIDAMKDWEPERVIFLLTHKREGSDSEVEAFRKQLQENAACSEETLVAVKALPKEGHPMKWLCSALLILGMCEGTGDYEQDAKLVISKIPHLVATIINTHAGWGETPAPDPHLGYMENFTAMLQVPGADKEVLGEAMRLFNILHYDHGGGNLSAFVGKAVASGHEDMYGSLCGAMCALAGPLHGRANQGGLEFVESIAKEAGENPTLERIEEILRERMAKKQLISGFGHAVLRVEDPRATLFYEFAGKHFADHPLVNVALLLREAGPKVLKENPKISNPYPNVDAMSGSMLTAAGLTDPSYYTVLFGLSRCVGIAAQIVYERCVARDGRGTPIIRPKYIYKPE